jgi:hypothetical protein
MEKQWISALFIAVAMVFLVAGCGDDDGGYEGVGRLVAERNRARFAQSGNKQLPQIPDKSLSSTPDGVKSSKDVVVEADVNVVGASSGKILARGTAYLDGNGKIITIRIEKN